MPNSGKSNCVVRVVFVDQESQMGGVEVTTLATASCLDAKGFSAQVVCPEPGDLVVRLKEAKIPVTIIRRPRFYSVTARVGRVSIPNPAAIIATAIATWLSANRLVDFLRMNADVVVTKGLLAHIYGGFAASRARVPCVWHVQEVANGASMGGLYVRLLNTLARRWAKSIVVDAPAVGAQFIQDLHDRGRVCTLYNGVDLERFSPSGPQADLPVHADGLERPLVIGQVGRIVPLKGQHVLIEAFAQVSRARPDLHLMLAGTPMFDTDHYLRKLKQMVSDRQLEGRVHFLGFRNDVPELLRAFDIFVHPSVEPDSPVSILEAMATGRPIIATGVPGTLELLSNGVEGYLVPPGDAEALAEKLDFLLDHPAERKGFAVAARVAAESRFDQQAFVYGFEQILADAVRA